MAKATYSYKVQNDFIIITDQDCGGMSVTNDIENVIKEIEQAENIDACNYHIIYRDSMGLWDGFDAYSQEFISLCELNEENAINHFNKLLKV
jgi:hypothetical protein